MATLRERVYALLEPGDRQGRLFDTLIVVLIVLNAIAIIFETVGDNATVYGPYLYAFELFSLIIFSAEYMLRLWSITIDPRFAHPIGGRVKWMFTPLAIIDLVAIVPAFIGIQDLRILRLARMLRLLKLGRYSESVQILTQVVRRRGEALLMSVFVVAIALVLLSSFMYYAEHDAQPETFQDIPHAMYWGAVTLATLGYGDVVPVTAAGKILAGFTALLGVGVIALPVGILASGFVEELHARGKAEKCPHCGKSVRGRT